MIWVNQRCISQMVKMINFLLKDVDENNHRAIFSLFLQVDKFFNKVL